MAEFTPIETQEQLDKIIGERIARAKASAAEKYADYDEIKAKNAEYVAQISSLQAQLQTQSETLSGNEASIADLTAKVKKYETDSVKTAIALELGLPYQMAGRLAGEDEKAIRADAEAMVKLIGAQAQPAPLGSVEPATSKNPADVARAKFSAWMQEVQNQ